MFRVSTKMLYTQSLDYINSNLTTLTNLNEQASSQKKVNKPSDDPAGTATILNLRTTLNSYTQYSENADTAAGWLSSSDSTLSSVSTIITRLKALAEQGATGTMSPENRTQIAYEARQYYEQLVSLANTEYQGKSMYAGQKTDTDAFSQCLWMTSNDEGLATSNTFAITGSCDSTVLVKFVNSGVGTGTSLMSACTVQYSTDGGTTYKAGSLSVDGAGKVDISMPDSGTSISFDHDASINVATASNTSYDAGTWMWLRPSAVYNGDDADASSTKVTGMGAGTDQITATARGTFSGNTIVRIDNSSPVTMDQEIQYSYSLDNGLTWVTGNSVAADGTSSNATLDVSTGGLLTLTDNGTNTLQPGAQFVITPATAGMKLKISASESVQINDVGKDIFGGIYQDPDVRLSASGARVGLNSSNATAVFSDRSSLYTSNGGVSTKNLFETVGNLVAFLETDNQTGVSQCLESLKLSQTQITTALASVGGRENRIETSQTILTNLTDSVNTQLSAVEDVDLTTLMTQLTQSQTTYQAVLKSSSMVMKMNLMDYL